MLALLLTAAMAVLDPASPAQFKALYEQNLERVQKKSGATSPQLERATMDFGLYLKSIGDREGAVIQLQHSLAIVETPEALDEYASLDASQTVRLLERAVVIRLERGQTVAAARTYTRLAAFYEIRRAPAVATDYYRSAMTVLEKAGSADDLLLAATISDLAYSLERQEKHPEAEALFRRALALQERKLGPRHPEVAVTLNNLAGVIGASGRAAQAEPLLRRSASILEGTLGPNHPRVAAALGNLADLLSATGRMQAAQQLYRRAIGIYDMVGDVDAKNHLVEALADGMRTSPGR